MNIKVNIHKNQKNFDILENNEVVIKALRPKWYSQQIRFFLNNRTYEIKKKSFWGSSYIITMSGNLIGAIPFDWKKGHYIDLYQGKKQYWIKSTRNGGIFSSSKVHSLLEGGVKSIIEIHYSWKKWKENIEVEILEKDDYSYELIMYAYFLMRLKQQAESTAASGTVGG